MALWRRARDSNPRYPLGYVGFQDRCHQPLGQLSAKSKIPPSEKPSRPGCYGLFASTLNGLCPASSRPTALPAFAASSSESVPVLSAESTVPQRIIAHLVGRLVVYRSIRRRSAVCGRFTHLCYLQHVRCGSPHCRQSRDKPFRSEPIASARCLNAPS